MLSQNSHDQKSYSTGTDSSEETSQTPVAKSPAKLKSRLGDVYLYWSGLTEFVAQCRGDERIHIGVRPWGMHSGNKVAMVAYPLHMCSIFEATRSEHPRFSFFISLNDWEPHQNEYYVSLDRHLYNVRPKVTSMQFTPNPDGQGSIVDKFEPLIRSNLALVQERFPTISIDFIRNSSLKGTPAFQTVLETTLLHPEKIGEILARNGGEEIELETARFAGAICPDCKSARGVTSYDGERVRLNCTSCGEEHSGGLLDFEYWLHYGPLFPPRMMSLGIDVALAGRDHYSDGSVNSIPELFELFGFKKSLDMIFSPMLRGFDGRKMSKEIGNTVDVPLERIIEVTSFSDKEFVDCGVDVLV